MKSPRWWYGFCRSAPAMSPAPPIMSTAAGWRSSDLAMDGRPGEISPNDPRILAIAALIRAEQEEEAGAGFPTLQRIPSTGAIKLLDYLAALPPNEVDLLLDAHARLGALSFFPALLI